MDLARISEEAQAALGELIELAHLKAGEVVVIGCSTSEVKGERIGSSTSLEIAEALFAGFTKAAESVGIALAFQGCEHINRAVVLSEAAALKLRLDPVQVIPVPHAGGAMAAYAFQNLPQAVVVESLNSQARAGLDIGDTIKVLSNLINSPFNH